MKARHLVLLIPALLLLAGASGGACAGGGPDDGMKTAGAMDEQTPDGSLELTDEEWRRRLTPEQYKVMREKGTEPAFTGAYVEKKDDGTYVCSACGNVLFSSKDKFDSGTGWPSYTRPAGEGSVATRVDRGHGMVRTEVVCRKCGAHLGHVFEDGPAPTGERYCINSVALDFRGEGDGGMPAGPAPCEIPPEAPGE